MAVSKEKIREICEVLPKLMCIARTTPVHSRLWRTGLKFQPRLVRKIMF